MIIIDNYVNYQFKFGKGNKINYFKPLTPEIATISYND